MPPSYEEVMEQPSLFQNQPSAPPSDANQDFPPKPAGRRQVSFVREPEMVFPPQLDMEDDDEDEEEEEGENDDTTALLGS